MDTFDRHELEEILSSEGGPHLSIFLPPPRRPSEARDDATRLTNVARNSLGKLAEHWMPKSEAEDFLKPLLDLAHETSFVSGRRHGVAVYLSDDVFKTYEVRRPIDENWFLGRTFRLRPMLATLDSLGMFHLLTLSKKRVALFAATSRSIREVTPEGLPESFEKSLSNVSADRGAQSHTAEKGVTGKQGAVFHGQGGAADSEKAELKEYLRQVENVVSSYLQDQPGFLMVAGVEYLTSIYQQVNSFARLMEPTISGNMNHLSNDRLLQQALPLATEELRREREEDAVRIGEQRRGPAVTDPEQILCAAHDGRIEAMFFDDDATLHGSFDPAARTMRELHHAPSGEPGDPSHDLIETAVFQTLRHRGRVHAATTSEMPVDAKMAAALRY